MTEAPTATQEQRGEPPHILPIPGRTDIYLRRVSLDTAEALFRAIETNAPYLSQYQPPWALEATLESTQRDIQERQEKAERGEWLDYELVEAINPDVVIGKGTFYDCDVKTRTGKFGYWVVEDKAGKGYASSMAQTMLNYGFEHWGLERIISEIDPENAASKRVAGEKLGLNFTGQYVVAPEEPSARTYEVWEMVKP